MTNLEQSQDKSSNQITHRSIEEFNQEGLKLIEELFNQKFKLMEEKLVKLENENNGLKKKVNDLESQLEQRTETLTEKIDADIAFNNEILQKSFNENLEQHKETLTKLINDNEGNHTKTIETTNKKLEANEKTIDEVKYVMRFNTLKARDVEIKELKRFEKLYFLYRQLWIKLQAAALSSYLLGSGKIASESSDFDAIVKYINALTDLPINVISNALTAIPAAGAIPGSIGSAFTGVKGIFAEVIKDAANKAKANNNKLLAKKLNLSFDELKELVESLARRFANLYKEQIFCLADEKNILTLTAKITDRFEAVVRKADEPLPSDDKLFEMLIEQIIKIDKHKHVSNWLTTHYPKINNKTPVYSLLNKPVLIFNDNRQRGRLIGNKDISRPEKYCFRPAINAEENDKKRDINYPERKPQSVRNDLTKIVDSNNEPLYSFKYKP